MADSLTEYVTSRDERSFEDLNGSFSHALIIQIKIYFMAVGHYS
jgi:hypothetical protein